MELRALGATGIEVSAVGLGTVKLGRKQGVKYPAPFELPSDAHAAALFDEARSLGINLVDTAPAYGSSERRVGEMIARDRNRWVVVTKAGEWFEGGRSRFDFSERALSESVRSSCERLGVERVDVVLVHSDGRDERIVEDDGALASLGRLKHAGLCRAIGMSVKSARGAEVAMDHGAEVLMVGYNLGDRSMGGVIERAWSRGVGVLIKKGLDSGHAASDQGGAGGSGVRRSLELVLGTRGVSSLVIGTIDPGHLREDVRIAESVLAGGR